MWLHGDTVPDSLVQSLLHVALGSTLVLRGPAATSLVLEL